MKKSSDIPTTFKCHCSADTIYKSEKKLQTHINRAHAAYKFDKAMECHFCDKSILYKKAMLAHIVSDHCTTIKEIKFSLAAKQKEIVTKIKNCKEHLGELEKLKKKEKDRINCGQCTNSYNDEKDLKWHIQKVHGGYCNLCGKSFNTHQYLKTHIAVFHELTEVNQCGKCDKIFASKYNLKKHKSEVHSQEKNMKIANHVQKSFQTKEHWQGILRWSIYNHIVTTS